MLETGSVGSVPYRLSRSLMSILRHGRTQVRFGTRLMDAAGNLDWFLPDGTLDVVIFFALISLWFIQFCLGGQIALCCTHTLH